MYGLAAEDIQNIRNAIARVPLISKVILYGSRDKGNYRPGSDIDLTLLGKNLTLKNSVYPLMDALEELNLPYTFDISIYSRIDNDDLLAHIQRVGEVFYRREVGLPEGWELKTIGELCNLIGGGTPSKNNEAFYSGDIDWATVRDMKNSLLSQTEFKITKEAVASSSTNIIKANNVVIATRVGLGKVCFLAQDTAINQDLRGVVPKTSSQLTVSFLFWWLKSIAHLIEKEGTGAIVKGVKLPFVKGLQIPLPPLPEQKRIVAILDKAFEGINQAVANAEKNLANGRELFESYLNTIFTRKGDGWEEKSLKSIGSIINGYAFKSKDFSNANDVKCIKITNVGVRNFVPNTSSLLPSGFDKQYKKVQVVAGGIVIALTRSIIADGLKVALIPQEYDCALLNQRVACVQAKEESVLPDYLYFYLCSAEVIDYVKRKANTLMQPNLSITDLKNLIVPVPSLSTQKNIVDGIQLVTSNTQHLQAIYQQKLKALIELKQSILQKAFSGELTANRQSREEMS